jgi:hypothetical protein
VNGSIVFDGAQPEWLFESVAGSIVALPLMILIGVVMLTSLMHLARGIGRLHAMFAKSLLVARNAPATPDTASASGAPSPAH